MLTVRHYCQGMSLYNALSLGIAQEERKLFSVVRVLPVFCKGSAILLQDKMY